MRLSGWVALALGTGAWLAACSAAACSPEAGGDSVIPAQGSAPSNLPALYWSSSTTAFGGPMAYDPTTLTVTRVDTGEVIPVTLSPAGTAASPFWGAPYLATLTRPLVAGGHYRVDSTASSMDAGTLHTIGDFTADPSAPLPKSLGTLSAGAQKVAKITVADVGGGCSAEVRAAQVPILLELSAEAKPWSDAFVYETLVDGKPYHPDDSLGYYALVPRPMPGASWVGRGKDILFALCEKHDTASIPSQATEGKHIVAIHAKIPGTQVDVSSAAIPVTLDCHASSGCECGIAGPRPSDGRGYVALLALAWLVRRQRER